MFLFIYMLGRISSRAVAGVHSDSKRPYKMVQLRNGVIEAFATREQYLTWLRNRHSPEWS